jgi:hypothetical protein
LYRYENSSQPRITKVSLSLVHTQWKNKWVGFDSATGDIAG